MPKPIWMAFASTPEFFGSDNLSLKSQHGILSVNKKTGTQSHRTESADSPYYKPLKHVLFLRHIGGAPAYHLRNGQGGHVVACKIAPSVQCPQF